MMSVLVGDAVEIIAQAPGIARGPVTRARPRSPRPPSCSWSSTSPSASTGTPANVPLRGVQPAAFATRPGSHDHRRPQVRMGKNEVLVGEGALQTVPRARRRLDASSGARTSGPSSARSRRSGAVWESEIWTDARVLQPSYRRGNSFQTVVARLSRSTRSTSSRTR